MLGVKKQFQESENSAKLQYIHDHMFGGLGILAGSIRNWASISCASHVVQMVEDAYRAAEIFEDCLLLLDRYFLTVPALKKLNALNRTGKVGMEIVTKARKPAQHSKKPGRDQPTQKRGHRPPERIVFLLERAVPGNAGRALWETRNHTLLQHRAALWGKSCAKSFVLS